jgi:hypothetical protein
MDIKKVCPKLKFQKTFAKKSSSISTCELNALICDFLIKNFVSINFLTHEKLVKIRSA